MNVCVVGLGKMGLPLAVRYASSGHSVIGCDIDPAVVAEAARGSASNTAEPGLCESLAAAVKSGRFTATTDTAAAAARSQVIVMVPPVLLDAANNPEFAQLDDAARAIGAGLQPGTLVILETTVPVGTTRERVGPLLQAACGLRPGPDFLLAYSPERVSSGSIFHDLRAYPKLIGGIDEASALAAADFYRSALGAEVLVLSDLETAEFAKLAESVYRDVNIALANELARAADSLGVDFVEAARAANTQPYSHLHQPGVGVGGHCIPVYPYFLPESAGLPLSRTARQINDGMATYAADLLEDALHGLSGKRILILGLAYRANVPESRYSSALLLHRDLRGRGAFVSVYDPLFPAEHLARLGLDPLRSFPPPRCDAVILQALHDEFRDIDFSAIPGCRVVLDGRNALAPGRVERAGVRYIGIGRATKRA